MKRGRNKSAGDTDTGGAEESDASNGADPPQSAGETDESDIEGAMKRREREWLQPPSRNSTTRIGEEFQAAIPPMGGNVEEEQSHQENAAAAAEATTAMLGLSGSSPASFFIGGGGGNPQ